MAQFIMKIRFDDLKRNPGRVEGNLRYINYIANKPEVALNKDEEILNTNKELEFDEELDMIEQENTDKYLQYIHERPNSHGLFDDNDERVLDLQNVRNEIRNHEGPIWHGILSLREDDAVKLGYVDREAWEKTLRSTMNEACAKMGIRPTNLRYVAAFHQKEGHPHVHVSWWEKSPERTRGVLSNWETKEMKKLFIKEFYAEENARLYEQKTATRDYLRDQSKKELVNAVDFIRNVRAANLDLKTILGDTPGVQPIFREKGQRELFEKLNGLSEMLPGKGRIAYKYMPPDVKEEVTKISDWMLKQPGMADSVKVLTDAAREVAERYTGDEEQLKEAEQNVYNDVRDRISQVVLKAAAECKRDNLFVVDDERAAEAVKAIEQSYKSVSLDMEKEQFAKTFVVSLAQAGMEYEDIEDKLKQWNEREQAGLSENNIKASMDYLSKIREKEITTLPNLSQASEYKQASVIATTLKAAGVDQEVIHESVKGIMDKSNVITDKLDKLVESGHLELNNDQYIMTSKLKEELSEVRVADKLEKAILNNVKDKAQFDIKELLDDKKVTDLAKQDNIKQTEFRFSKYDANVVFKEFEGDKLNLNQLKEKLLERYSSQDQAIEHFNILSSRIEKLATNGYVDKGQDESYTINTKGVERAKEVRSAFEFTTYDANVVFKYIENSNGILSKETLKAQLTEEYKDSEEVEKKFNYLIKRLENNLKEGYVEKAGESYKVTEKGRSSASELVGNAKGEIQAKLEYLSNLGFLEKVTDTQYNIVSKEEITRVISRVGAANLQNTGMDKNIYDLLEKNKGNINIESIKRQTNQLIDNILKNVNDKQTDYSTVRDTFKVQDTVDRVVQDMSKVLLGAGLDQQRAVQIIYNYAHRTKLPANDESIQKTVEKISNQIKDVKSWNREQVLNTSSWKNLYRDLGYTDREMPKWMYKAGNNFTQNNILGIVNKAWKAAWNNLKREELRQTAEAEHMKKKDVQQHTLQNKEFRKELYRNQKGNVQNEEMEQY